MSVCGCVGVWEEGGGGGGKGRNGIARFLNRSHHKIVKYCPFTNWEKKEKVMVNYQPAEEGPCGENLKILPSNGDLNSKNLPVGK